MIIAEVGEAIFALIRTKDLTPDLLMVLLSQGTIPVIVHNSNFDATRPNFLPLSELIDWNLAAVLTEVAYLQVHIRKHL